MQIRSLAIDDYEQMVQLWRKARLHFRSKGRDSRNAIEAQMKSGVVFFIGAFIDSSLVGIVIASCDGRKGWINRLAVDPSFRQQGIAKALIVEAEKVLRRHGMRVFSALIKDSNEVSKTLYRKSGYTEFEDILYFSKRYSEKE